MMENFAKLIQAEWDNIWDFVFGRDQAPESEPAEIKTEIETEAKDSQ
jgi:hypothetical protein